MDRARGTDLIRLRPESASVRFLRNFAGPPSESVLEADGGGASAVRFGPPGKIFYRPLSESVLEAD